MKQIYYRSPLSQINSESRKICGYAIVFNKWSQDLGGFVERILPSAITQDLIDNSDVIANLEHDSENKMLARCRNGNGTLHLELREDGVYFEFDAPETQLGDEVLFHIRNGNLFECSFCFSLAEDGDVWYRDENNKVCRDITNIAGLYDICVCAHGAYSDTFCYARNLEEEQANSEIMEKFLEEEKRTIETKTETVELEEGKEEVEEEPKEEVEERNDEPTVEEEEEIVDENPADEAEDKEISDEESDEENKEEKKDNKRKMEKNFSLLKTIRSIVENKPLDEVSEAVISAGKEEMRKSGLNYAGQIQIPSEMRATVTVTAEGEDVVATDLYDIMTPLRAKNVLAQAGAKFLTNLVGDVNPELEFMSVLCK